MRDDFAEAVSMLAKSVADEVGFETKEPVGYFAKVVERFNRVEFTFRVGVVEARMKYSVPTMDITYIKSHAISWQPLFDELVMKVLFETSPLGYAQRLARKKEEGHQPEIPVFVDQQGRRHHTLKCETGFLEGIFSKVKFQKETTQQ